MIGGGKLSKSEARLLDLEALIDRHGTDAFRFVLLREAPWDSDRDFASAEDFIREFDERYEAELANDLGNLLNRTVAMVHRYRDGAVPDGAHTELDAACEEAMGRYREAMDGFLLHAGIEAAMAMVRAANGFVDASRPWELARNPGEEERLDAVLAALVRCLCRTATTLSPFMPGKCEEMWRRLGGSGDPPALADVEARIPTLLAPRDGSVLFPRPEPEA
jgi:methionyl-tRNA synthetase